LTIRSVGSISTDVQPRAVSAAETRFWQAPTQSDASVMTTESRRDATMRSVEAMSTPPSVGTAVATAAAAATVTAARAVAAKRAIANRAGAGGGRGGGG